MGIELGFGAPRGMGRSQVLLEDEISISYTDPQQKES